MLVVTVIPNASAFSLVIIAKKKEENNRMGKSRDLFKKIRDTKGTFHAKMGTIKKLYGPN